MPGLDDLRSLISANLDRLSLVRIGGGLFQASFRSADMIGSRVHIDKDPVEALRIAITGELPWVDDGPIDEDPGDGPTTSRSVGRPSAESDYI